MKTPQSLVESTARMHGASDLAGCLARDLLETQKELADANDHAESDYLRLTELCEQLHAAEVALRECRARCSSMKSLEGLALDELTARILLLENRAEQAERARDAAREALKSVKPMIEQYSRPDFYLWLLSPIGGLYLDPCKRAADAMATIDAAIDAAREAER